MGTEEDEDRVDGQELEAPDEEGSDERLADEVRERLDDAPAGEADEAPAESGD